MGVKAGLAGEKPGEAAANPGLVIANEGDAGEYPEPGEKPGELGLAPPPNGLLGE